MIGISIANSLGLSAAAAGPDPSASAYFTATGITGSTQQQAIDNLVKGLKADGLWSKMKAVYPFVTDNRNLLGYTEDFGNAYWAKTNATVTTNTTTDPNGGTNADTITDNTTNGQHKLQTSDITTTVGTGNTFVVSGYFKANTATRVCIYAYGSSKGVGVDLTNGTQITVNGLNNASASDITITADNYGFYRVTMKGTVSGAFSIAIFVISGNDFSYVGTGTSLYMYGAQLELGSTATTYQPIATTQQAFISNQFKYNLVNPVDSDAAFRLVFNGGWTHSANGATPNGTNGYADTKLVPSSVLQLNSASHSVYSRNTSPIGIIGGVNDVSNYMILNNPTSTTITSQINSIGADFITGTITNSQGLLMANRTSSTVINAWRNSTKVATDTKNTTARPTKNYYIGARNSDGTAAGFDGKQYGFYHIGDGLTDTEAANLYTAVQAFQTSLSRQV